MMSRKRPNNGSNSSFSSQPIDNPKTKFALKHKQGTGFVEGAIVRIKLSSFLTYDAVEFKTGPYLNVIIGPNGTGKSAIVCAICLGLAGKTTWLGRASEPRDFIKYGAEKGNIEIELFNPYDDSNYVISRQINKNNTSQWWINKRSSPQKMVEELVARLNIQVGNLCQFLPQEKVASFARMTQQELLENTEKSVGRDNLYENHQKLKSARQEARILETDVDKLKEELDQQKQKNDRVEQDVQSYKDREAFLKKVEVLKMKKPWLEYNMLKVYFERAKEERDKKTDELKRERTGILPLQRKFDALKREKDELKTQTKEMSQKIRTKANELQDHSNTMMNKSDKIEEAKRDFDSKLKEEEARKKKLRDLQEQLRALEEGLSQMDDSDARVIAASLERTAEELRKVNGQLTGVQTQGERLHREINDFKSEIRANEGQLQKIQDVNNRRLETLRTLHQHTYEAVVWLRANKDQFKHTIHEPMIISINVTNPANARLVESHISFNDLRSFVCEDPDDFDLFIKKTRQEQRLRINAVTAPQKPPESYSPPNPIANYKKYGFQAYLQSLFTCPGPVMSFLCENYNVHKIPIGSNAIKNNIELIMRDCKELYTFYAPDVQYSMKQSKYTGKVSTRNTALRDPRALVDSVNAEKEEELKRLIKESSQQQKSKEGEYRVLQRESEDLGRQINELREKKRSLMKQKDQRKSVENQIQTKKQRIEQVMKEAVNIQAEEQKLRVQLKKIVAEKFEHLKKMRTISVACLDIEKRRLKSSLSLAERDQEFSVIETELRNVRQRFEALEKEVEELKEHSQDLKQQAREKLTEAKRMAGMGGNQDLEEVLTQRGVWDVFNDASSNLEELESEIHSMQARAESLFQVDEMVVREYEQRKKDITRLEQNLLECDSRRQTHQEDITEAKRQWLEPLSDLIQQINTNFSYFFSCLQCCGEVSLSVPENPEDYEKYGVCIKVKFRDDENLRELTAHHQSGGERSVSTVLYMMALQELTKCPFRSVDEINQGMDPKNERKIFQLVVQTVCKKSASQYFLLTPKLLPDLDYDDNMTVLCVYNGPNMMGHKDWNLKNFIRRRAAVES